jgi:HEAT repeat protein
VPVKALAVAVNQQPEADPHAVLIDRAIADLQARRSPHRRSAAKRLRKLKDPAAGPALLAALQKELQAVRTWETQYQLLMALAECEYRPALPYLQQLAFQPFEATVLYTALGDTIVRLGRSHEQDPSPILWAMGTQNPDLIDGAFRGMAMLRMTPDKQSVAAIIQYVSALPVDDPVRFWVAAAAPGWRGPDVERFLTDCARSSREDIRSAAIAAEQGKYQRWRPL